MDSDDESPTNGDFTLEHCYLYFPDQTDRNELKKRIDDVYDYVAHWEVSPGLPDQEKSFEHSVMQDSYEINRVKIFLYSMDEPFAAEESLDLTVTPIPHESGSGIWLHGSQNLYERHVEQ